MVIKTIAIMVICFSCAVHVAAQSDIPIPPPPDPAPPPDSPVDFESQILPIFEANCIKCHGANRQKGKLRLDSRSGVFKGEDSNKWVIVPGDVDASELFYRISLEPDDLDIMPAKGDTLSSEQIELIRAWIEQGADWPDTIIVKSKVKPLVLPEMTPTQIEDEARVVELLVKRGAIAIRLSSESRGLYVNLSMLDEKFTDKDMKLLQGLEYSLVWLNLARTGISDSASLQLKELKQLRRLHLENTAVSDKILQAVGELDNLEYLNLYGTVISDAGLQPLTKLSQLNRLYLWKTNVSDSGVEQLQDAIDGLRVDRGGYSLTLTSAQDQELSIADMTCCEQAIANGVECDHACCKEAAAKGEVCLKCNPSGVIRNK